MINLVAEAFAGWCAVESPIVLFEKVFLAIRRGNDRRISCFDVQLAAMFAKTKMSGDVDAVWISVPGVVNEREIVGLMVEQTGPKGDERSRHKFAQEDGGSFVPLANVEEQIKLREPLTGWDGNAIDARL